MSAQTPEISVLVPVYNVEKHIARCIESILRQPFSDFELIIVDDCTPDNSVEIIRRYMEADSRIRLISKPENEGLMLARKTGYMAAQGRYVVFCDSDDALCDGALQLLYDQITSTEADIVLASCYYMPDGGGRRYFKRGIEGEMPPAEAQRQILTQQLKTYLWGGIYKRELLTTHIYESFKNVTICEDRLLMIQLLENCKKIHVSGEPVCQYYQNMASSTRTAYNDRKLQQAMSAYDWCYSFFARKNKFPQELRYFYIRLINYFLESGITMKRLRNASQWIDKRYNSHEVSAEFGLRGVLHSFMLSHCHLYCQCCHAGRMLIRIIQRKKQLRKNKN